MGKTDSQKVKHLKKAKNIAPARRKRTESHDSDPVPETPIRRSTHSGRIIRTPVAPDTPSPAPRKAGAASRKRVMLIDDSPATSPIPNTPLSTLGTDFLSSPGLLSSPTTSVENPSSPTQSSSPTISVENLGNDGVQENTMTDIFSSPGSAPARFAAMYDATKPKNRWVSKGNALHGYVQNVHVGTQEYTVPRHRALRTVRYTESKSALRFSRLMDDLFSRAEKCYHETGAWLHLVAQHPNAKQAHLSYISPRLRREARQDELLNAHKHIANLIYSCKSAHRHTAQELSSKLAARELELEATKKVVDEQAAEIRRLSAQA